MGLWKIETYDPSGALIAELSSKATQRKFRRIRNRADTITLTFDLDDLKRLCAKLHIDMWSMFEVNRNEIRVSRLNTPWMAGQIPQGAPVVDEDKREVTVMAVGWFDLLGSKYTDEGGSSSPYYFAGVDAGQIGWNMIDEKQSETNGNMGITQGIIQTSVPRDRKDYSFKNIKEAIIQLTEVINGFDVEITWDKKYNVYYPKQGQRRENIILTYPGSIQNISFQRSGLEMANKVIARGGGTGVDAFMATAVDLASQAKYGLREAIVDFPDISTPAVLQEHADAELLARSGFADVPDVILSQNKAPAFGSYGIGDELLIQVTDDLDIFGPVNDWFRIDGIEIDLDENDAEHVRLMLMR